MSGVDDEVDWGAVADAERAEWARSELEDRLDGLVEAMETLHERLYQLHISGDAGRMVEDEVEIAATALRRVKGEAE